MAKRGRPKRKPAPPPPDPPAIPAVQEETTMAKVDPNECPNCNPECPLEARQSPEGCQCECHFPDKDAA